MLRAVPKPQKPRRRTADLKRYMNLVAQLPCLGCGYYPVALHHCIMGRFSQQKAGDEDVLPLCPSTPWRKGCHDLPHNRDQWRARFGDLTDFDLLPRVREQVAQLKRRTV